MENMMSTIQQIKALDHQKMAAAQAHLDNLTKPQGSLGRLEDLAKQLMGISGKDRPDVSRKVMFTLAADHGIAAAGVSAYPQAVTVQMVHNFLNGGAGVNVLARQSGAKVVVVDIGVNGEFDAHPDLVNRKIRYGTADFSREPAMTRDEAIRSINVGIELVRAGQPAQFDLIGIGEMGIGNTTAASAITVAITGSPVDTVTGRGTGIEDTVLQHKVKLITEAINLHQPQATDAIEVLSKIGGLEIGGMTGIILGAAAEGIPVVVDGFIAGAAALLAYLLAPLSRHYMIAAHRSVEPGHKAIIDYLGLDPLYDLGLRLGEGTGAALAFHLVEAAARIYNEMATFASAGVSGKS